MDYSNNWSIDDIKQFENEMNQISCNDSNFHCDQPSHTKCMIKNDETENEKIEFPLLRLPIDLIAQTSLYLNEKDIFQFECCRLFYQMINNTSYLNTSKNFKTFTIEDKTLDQMSQRKNCFFKYSKTKHLRLHCDGGRRINIDRWQKAMNIVKMMDGLIICGNQLKH